MQEYAFCLHAHRCTLLLVGVPSIGVVLPGPTQNAFSARTVCLVGPTAGREGVYPRSDLLQAARPHALASQGLGLPSPSHLNVPIG